MKSKSHLLPIVLTFVLSSAAFASATPRLPSGKAAPQSGTPVQVRWQVEQQLFIGGDKPVYPSIAMIAHIEGVVRAQILVSKDGSVTNARYLSGPPLLMRAALESVKTWKFKQALVNGQPVEVETVAEVSFYLPGDDPSSRVARGRKELEAHPNDPRAHATLAAALRLAAMFPEALNEYKEALRLQPRNAEFQLGLAGTLQDSGDVKSAIAEFKTYLAMKPKDGEATIQLADLLRDSGDTDDAIAEYRLAANHTSTRGEAHCQIGLLLYKKNDMDAAIEEFRRAESDEYRSAEMHFDFGNAYLQKSDTKNAEKEFKKALAEEPENQTYRDALNHAAHAAN